LPNTVLIVLAIATVPSIAVAEKLIPVEASKQNISCPIGDPKTCRKLVEDAAARYCIALKYKSGWPSRLVQLGDVWTLLAVQCD